MPGHAHPALFASASERFYAGHRDRTLPARPARLAYWAPDKGPVQRHNDYIHYEDDTIGELLRNGGNRHREFRLSDGTAVTYNHDELVRRTAGGSPDYADPTYCPVTWRE